MTDSEMIPVPESIPACKCCFVKINPADQFCKNCGFPLQGTEAQQNDFIYQRGYKKMQVNELTDKASRAAITFYILAGVLLLSGLVTFFVNAQSDESVPNLIVYGILSVLFLFLGGWSNKKPVAAIICGLALYIVLILLQAAVDFKSVFSGVIIKVLIIAGLIKALTSALEAERIKKQHNF